MDDAERLFDAGRTLAGDGILAWTPGDHAKVAAKVRTITQGSSLQPILSQEHWQVDALQPQGSTALGPALACALGIAFGLGGAAEIVLCTDGMVSKVSAQTHRANVLTCLRASSLKKT